MPRQTFEARLQQHYKQPRVAEGDLNWYALRNTVFAIGCRLVLSPGGLSSNFAAAQKQSWSYFENSLSVHMNLVYTPSDITTIETLVLMVS